MVERERTKLKAKGRGRGWALAGVLLATLAACDAPSAEERARAAAEEIKQGVVDPNSRIHGMSNMYVAGSSVFPTAGANFPTFTLVALSLRLADHLVVQLGAPDASTATGEPRAAASTRSVLQESV